MTTRRQVTRVFVSSTAVDLRRYRDTIVQVIGLMDAFAIEMEQFGATNATATAASRDQIAASDIFILLVGWRYGYIPAGQTRSITHSEYEYARQLGIPIFVFMADTTTAADIGDTALFPASVRDSEYTQQLLAFRQQLSQENTVAIFTTPESLAQAVAKVIYRTLLQTSEIRPGPPRDNKVFISYRWLHVPYAAGRIYDWLEHRFGADAVFFDVINMPPWKDFRKYVRQVISQCAVELVVVTPLWVDARDEVRRRRLDQPEDTVRIEVETALEYDKEVIPLLVDGAVPPTERQLPASIQTLSRRNGLPIRDGRDFLTDIQRLIDYLEPYIGAGA